MQQKSYMTQSDVALILDTAQAYAKQKQWAVTIAVADDGGHLLGLLRMDRASPFTAQVAPAKARTAAMGRRESKGFEDMINQGRYAFGSVPLSEGMLEGGVPVIVDGQVVGAVGVSGVKSHEDVEIARAGIAALGL
ncbi:GlcG/HbpS family heme-binding protein [Kerstersia similis]|uniref:GlcG/HbpS family heme-binding protein n=1 Tax=Kerstersia similis TaxID=206505 RepID=UPI0039EE4165